MTTLYWITVTPGADSDDLGDGVAPMFFLTREAQQAAIREELDKTFGNVSDWDIDPNEARIWYDKGDNIKAVEFTDCIWVAGAVDTTTGKLV